MQCPFCGASEQLDVKDTRRDPDGSIMRRRRCSACGHDTRTIEHVADANVRVRKADGSVVQFSSDAVMKSVRKAAVRRRQMKNLNQLAENVRQKCMHSAVDNIVDSSTVGDHTLAELYRVDQVSYVRFAMVQLGRLDSRANRSGWRDAHSFREWLGQQFPHLPGSRVKVDLSSVVKRDWRREDFDIKKLEASIGYASKGRGRTDQEVYDLASDVAREVYRELRDQPLVLAGQLAAEVLRCLRGRDHVAFLRYASSAKGYRRIDDYETEAVALRNR